MPAPDNDFNPDLSVDSILNDGDTDTDVSITAPISSVPARLLKQDVIQSPGVAMRKKFDSFDWSVVNLELKPMKSRKDRLLEQFNK